MESYTFYGWWLLGRAGVFRMFKISYRDSAYLSADHAFLFSVIGRLCILCHNTLWRISLIKETLRTQPKIRFIR